MSQDLAVDKAAPKNPTLLINCVLSTNITAGAVDATASIPVAGLFIMEQTTYLEV